MSRQAAEKPRDQLPSPDRILEAFQAFQRTAAVKAGIELDLFTAIGQGVDTPAGLANRCGAAERGIRILCDFLAAAGFLKKQGDRYALGPEEAAYLDRRSPAYFGSALSSFAAETTWTAFAKLASAVRAGATALPGEGTMAHDHSIWAQTARALAPIGARMGRRLARFLGTGAAGPIKVLDLAAGHGMFGIAIAGENPQAEIYAVDWPSVLAVASEHAKAADLTARFHALPGDAFSVEFGGGYDIALITNFLPDLDPAGCDRLLRKVRAALLPHGRAVAFQLIADEDRTSPRAAAGLNLTLLATTPAGEVYTGSELERMFRRAGFARVEMHDLIPSGQRVVIAQL